MLGDHSKMVSFCIVRNSNIYHFWYFYHSVIIFIGPSSQLHLIFILKDYPYFNDIQSEESSVKKR